MCAMPQAHLVIIKDHVTIAEAEMQTPTATTPHLYHTSENILVTMYQLSLFTTFSSLSELPYWFEIGIFAYLFSKAFWVQTS